VADYATALADTLAALGCERCVLYGLGAGAAVALHHAAHHPTRVALAVFDGLEPPGSEPGQGSGTHAPAAPVPCDDGSHLATAWTSLLDWHRHWPPRPVAGVAPPAGVTLPDDVTLHESAVDLFSAGQGSDCLAQAAQRFDAPSAAARLRVPAVHLERDVEPAASVRRTQLLEVLRSAHLSASRWQPPSTTRPATRGEWQRYVDLLHGTVRVRLWGEPGESLPVLLLHDLPGGSASLRDLAAGLAATRPVIAPDLPGLGDSQPLPYPSLGSYVVTLAEMLETLGTASLDIAAEGLGTTFAIALAAHRPGHVRRLVLDGAPMIRSRERRRVAQHYCPPVVPDRHGAYLQRLWHQLRDGEFSWPWFERAAQAARSPASGLDPERRQQQLVDVMKQLPSYGDAARAALEASVRDLLPAVTQPVLLLDVAGDVRYASTARAARRLAGSRILPRPAAAAQRAELAGAFLS
jgi:pimeloyl-ACP methyl ester carboxylesterase